jgi:hypothetical protein
MIAAANLGLDVPEPYRMAYVYGIMVPMIVAWVVVAIEVLTRHC